ncbi:Aste57867_25191 [Aphanomyces stellatus]|uniref:Aste57867_25191 protein n=1 Tax=Aphanomyces stellatus TaxID=120398 RepID=A0A485KH20_9STRA|nr:hypothetical protein As57867_025113 [Aphanomyces stellatus]KAF0712499.1 hypothetical protein As57867_004797 [Aphanomyces stellatus]VFT81904.1 Aste57867_4810 [Aphanomyces stellatus]VFU01820.1 Aste57867_25191 [Aphanomyces stellatus]
MTCYFNDCTASVKSNAAIKCYFHRHRAICLIDNCRNQVYARKLCVKHGGKRRCQVGGCSANARVGNFCSRHASTALKRVCEVNGCDKQPRAHRRCAAHGGGKKCCMAGCPNNARGSDYCAKHTPKVDEKPTSHDSDGQDDLKWDLLLMATSLDDTCVDSVGALDDECLDALGLFAIVEL